MDLTQPVDTETAEPETADDTEPEAADSEATGDGRSRPIDDDGALGRAVRRTTSPSRCRRRPRSPTRRSEPAAAAKLTKAAEGRGPQAGQTDVRPSSPRWPPTSRSGSSGRLPMNRTRCSPVSEPPTRASATPAKIELISLVGDTDDHVHRYAMPNSMRPRLERMWPAPTLVDVPRPPQGEMPAGAVEELLGSAVVLPLRLRSHRARRHRGRSGISLHVDALRAFYRQRKTDHLSEAATAIAGLLVTAGACDCLGEGAPDSLAGRALKLGRSVSGHIGCTDLGGSRHGDRDRSDGRSTGVQG